MTKIRSADSSMIDDRRGSGGGGLPGLAAVDSRSRSRPGRPARHHRAARVDLPAEAARRRPDAAGVPQPADRTATPTEESCTTELEQIVCGATERRADLLADQPADVLRQRTYEVTKTVFFTDGVDTGCGQATSQTGPFYCPADHLVYIDLGFMQQLEQQLVGKPTDLAEQYIIAHEYGHHVQNLLGINGQVQQAQQNDPGRANQYSVAMELQADCFAGMWVGDVASRGLLDVGRRDQRGARRGRGCRRRPHPGEDAGPDRQGGVDARLGRAAPDVVHARLQLRRPERSATRSARFCRHRRHRCCRRTCGRPTRQDRCRTVAATCTAATIADDPEAGGEGQRDIETGRADQVPPRDERR